MASELVQKSLYVERLVSIIDEKYKKIEEESEALDSSPISH